MEVSQKKIRNRKREINVFKEAETGGKQPQDNEPPKTGRG